MRRLFIALAIAVAVPLQAQGPLIVDVHNDLSEVQQKLVGLAKAIPESAYGWRPGAGVRSVGEVFMHVAAENYLIPAFMGAPAPAATGITTDFKTSDAYTMKARGKDAIVAELEASFQHAHQALHVNTDANLGEKIKMFGMDLTRQRAMILMITHLHEHLGQMIAYARSNNVVPPWSR
ncbi:MAG: DinB family protein [Gemmatimonadaceae bacterium]